MSDDAEHVQSSVFGLFTSSCKCLISEWLTAIMDVCSSTREQIAPMIPKQDLRHSDFSKSEATERPTVFPLTHLRRFSMTYSLLAPNEQHSQQNCISIFPLDFAPLNLIFSGFRITFNSSQVPDIQSNYFIYIDFLLFVLRFDSGSMKL